MFDGESDRGWPLTTSSPQKQAISENPVVRTNLVMESPPANREIRHSAIDYQEKYENLLAQHRQAQETILKQAQEIERLRR